MSEKAFLVAIGFKGEPAYRLSESLRELEELTRSAGGMIVEGMKVFLERPHAATYLGIGKLEEIHGRLDATKADLLIFNQNLSPVQMRNIESSVGGRRVVDRTGLILDIFSRRAQSHEGRLQVELAQLLYLMPRLTGRGVLLSRLGGGIGTRGPGEKKLEYDRRRIRERIGRLKKETEKIRRHRLLIRQGRQRKDFATVAIIGYTNAGKSTLLNSLTGSSVLVEDKLFATLDPTTRIFRRADRQILFTDTVGFITDLPPNLIEAFQATLEEMGEADLLLHIVDVTHSQAGEQKEAVDKILKQLHFDDKPIVTVLNKVDLIASEEEKQRLVHHYPGSVSVSAKYRQGLETLIEKVESCLKERNSHRDSSF